MSSTHVKGVHKILPYVDKVLQKNIFIGSYLLKGNGLHKQLVL